MSWSCTDKKKNKSLKSHKLDKEDGKKARREICKGKVL
jgi:hypothetical protein